LLRDIINQEKQKIVDGITYSFDSTREKWLSIGRYYISYAINHKNVHSSRSLAISGGIYSNNIGFKTPEYNSGILIAATIQTKNITSCSFIIVENNYEIGIVILQLNNESEKTINLNTDIQPGAVLKCFIKTNGNLADYPFVVLECATRL